MGHIKDLREHIGTRPIILVGAAVLLRDGDGRLLLLERKDNRCWGWPGGAMEPGESLEDTVRREAKEETGLRLLEPEFLGVASGAEMYYKYPNGDEVHNVTGIFAARTESGNVEIDPSEHLGFCFFEPLDLPDDISPPDKPPIKRFFR